MCIADTGANGIVVSDTQAKVYIWDFGAYLMTRLVKYFPSVLSLGRLSNELCVSSSSWPTRETPRLSERNKEFECNIENFVPHGCSYYTEGSTIHLNSRKPREPRAGKRSGGHRVGSLTTIYRMVRRSRCIFFNFDSWGWPSWGYRREFFLMTNFLLLSPMQGDILWKRNNE